MSRPESRKLKCESYKSSVDLSLAYDAASIRDIGCKDPTLLENLYPRTMARAPVLLNEGRKYDGSGQLVPAVFSSTMYVAPSSLILPPVPEPRPTLQDPENPLYMVEYSQAMLRTVLASVPSCKPPRTTTTQETLLSVTPSPMRFLQEQLLSEFTVFSIFHELLAESPCLGETADQFWDRYSHRIKTSYGVQAGPIKCYFSVQLAMSKTAGNRMAPHEWIYFRDRTRYMQRLIETKPIVGKHPGVMGASDKGFWTAVALLLLKDDGIVRSSSGCWQDWTSEQSLPELKRGLGSF